MVHDRDNLNGHKVCSGCGRDKPLEDFNKNPRGKFGRRSDCRECAKVKAALKVS
jgi:hypothetical protein